MMMSDSSVTLNWSVELFSECYNSIKSYGTVPVKCREALKHDLQSVLLVPARNEKSRSSLAAGEKGSPVTFHNGLEYTLNPAFVTATGVLSSEVNLDELSAAELLQEASSSTFAHSSSIIDAGILGFYKRYSYILNILGFLVAEKQLHLIYDKGASEFLSQILKSFKQIYSLLSLQNDFIDKEHATGDVNNMSFVNKVRFAREQLFELHDLLAQVLFSLLDSYFPELGNHKSYMSISSHINECVKDDSDSILLHYLPALMRIITGLSDMKDDQVCEIHLKFAAEMEADYSKIKSADDNILPRFTLRSHELLMHLIFFISLVPWCKETVSRTQRFDFQKDILRYTEWLINLGTMEQLLCFTAESANPKTGVLFDQSKLYDFRPLLQRSIPRLSPTLFKHARHEDLLHVAKNRPDYSNLLKLCDISSFRPSENLREALLAPFFHSFFCDFVNHSAIILTSLRDNEEDFLLSSTNKDQTEIDNIMHADGPKGKNSFHDSESKNSVEYSKNEMEIDLDELASRAELERFYLAFSYTYSHRVDISKAFWSHDSGNVAGFVSWGLANNTSPLITATFCLLLGSLTYGGHAAAEGVWETLCKSSTSQRKDYSQISVDSIVSSLTYYLDALEESFLLFFREEGKLQQKRDSLFAAAAAASTTDSDQSPIQFSEDSIVFIAGFLMLISAIVENSTDTHTKQSAFMHFSPLITSFLRLDNMITTARSSISSYQSCTPFFNDDNRTALVNLVLHLLAKFAENTEDEMRCKIWILIDRWVSHTIAESEPKECVSIEQVKSSRLALTTSSMSTSEGEKLKSEKKGISLRKGFEINLTKTSEVLNFVKLSKSLLSKSASGTKSSIFSLPFPSDLGHEYRLEKSIGVWPYIEYLLVDVFGKSSGISCQETRLELQCAILNIVVSSLNEIDWNLIGTEASKILPDFSRYRDRFARALNSSGESIVLSLQTFTRLHHSIATINYLFDGDASDTLLEIINKKSDDFNEGVRSLHAVKNALKSLHLQLQLQDTFIQKLPILKNFDGSQVLQNPSAGYGTSMSIMLSSSPLEYNNIYFPDDLGTKGVSNFYEKLLHNIPSVVNIALLVGSCELSLANVSLEILYLVTNAPEFGFSPTKNLLHHNRLLTIFQSIDESDRIRFAFAQQLGARSLSIVPKIRILRFLIENLSSTYETTISHFLLGFDTRAGKLKLSGSAVNESLLSGLLDMLIETMSLISDVDYTHGYQNQIGFEPITLSSLIMEILVCLSQNSNSSEITLQFLRSRGLFDKLVSAQPKIDEWTIWHKCKFNCEKESHNPFLEDQESRDTFYEFVSFRKSVLKYLSLELHDIKSRSQREYYIESLLDGSEFLNGTAKVLNFLDVLQYKICNSGERKLPQFENSFSLPSLIQEIDSMSHELEYGDATGNVIGRMSVLRCKLANNVLPDHDGKIAFQTRAAEEASELGLSLAIALYIRGLRNVLSDTLHAWVQIVQVVASDEATKKLIFVPQVLQVILPKIDLGLYEQDISLAEKSISLCLFLFDVFESSSETEYFESSDSNVRSLFALFKTCVNGLLCSGSSSRLRSDLYLLINKFILKGSSTDRVLNEIMSLLRSTDARFFDIVCNDSVNSEGVSRITSLILLETLIHLSQKEDSALILTSLTKRNTLSLLVRSLKRADDILIACGEGSFDSGITIESVFYELTALKTTLFAFTRLGQSRSGALKLVESEIFSTLQRLRVLNVDADLGLTFHFRGDDKSLHQSTVRLTLEVPLTLRDKLRHGPETTKTLSLNEILIPIFQLITTIILSLGPSYKPGLVQVEKLLMQSRSIILGVLKRDSLVAENRPSHVTGSLEENLQYDTSQLVKLITLLYAVLPRAEGADI